jgi:hypothetical protein
LSPSDSAGHAHAAVRNASKSSRLGEKAEHSFTPHAFLSRPFRVKRDSTLSSPEWTI